MTGKSGVRNDESVLLTGFCIWYTLEDSGKWVGEEKGDDELHCSKLASGNAKGQQRRVVLHSSTEAPVAELAYWNAVVVLTYCLSTRLERLCSSRMLIYGNILHSVGNIFKLKQVSASFEELQIQLWPAQYERNEC